MSKIDKKIRLVSTDIYDFSKDPFRKLISDIDPETLNISLKPNFNLFYDPEAYLAGRYNGAMEIDCHNENVQQIVNTVNSIKNADILNVNMIADKHYEMNEEVKKEGLQNVANLLKFETKFTYSYLSKNYENYLNTFPTISELNYPYFYEILQQQYDENNLKKFSGPDYFIDPIKIITDGPPRNNMKNILFSSPESFNDYSNQFPFFADVRFDTKQNIGDSISNVFTEKNLYNEMLNLALFNMGNIKLAVSENSSFQNINKIQRADFFNILFGLTNDERADASFILKINERIKNNRKTLPEIIGGAPSYTEVVGYVLKKYDLFGPKAAPLQQWLFANPAKAKTFRFIDSQIKYNKKYRYSLDAIVMSIDTSYKYISAGVISPTKILVEYSYAPRVNLYIVENSSEYTNKVLSQPPVKPEIDFLPYVDINNRLKMNLYNNTKKNIVEKPIPITINDFTYFEDIKRTQGSLNGKVSFSYDDGTAKKFEVFRSTEKPTSYEDFNNKLIYSVDSNGLENISLVDNIVPEKYYYYTFRVIDYHDQVSNPSQIYELIHSNGSLLVKPYDIYTIPQESYITFRKHIQISPSVLQIQAQEDSKKIVLGIGKESLWDKKFKIRLTSRSTGKKIDLNLTFKYNNSYNS